MYHEPVLLQESIEGLNLEPGGIYVDATYGGGGHSAAILSKLGSGRLIAFDRDPDALANKPDDDRLVLLNNNFMFLKNFLRQQDAVPVDGILADLGVSSHQIDTPSRGFSMRFDAPLDMRMGSSDGMSATDILKNYSEEELADVFGTYGEIRNAGRIARTIINVRKTRCPETTVEFMELLSSFAPPAARNKLYAKAFQALRIVVNSEMESLKALLVQSLQVLKPGGRLVVISYHSLEDRLVKKFMRSGNFDGNEENDLFGRSSSPFRLVVRKAVVAGENEIKANPRSRSARLRIAEKL